MLPDVQGTLGGVVTRFRIKRELSGVAEEVHKPHLALPVGCPQPTKCGHQKQAQSQLCLETGPHGTPQPSEGQVAS